MIWGFIESLGEGGIGGWSIASHILGFGDIYCKLICFTVLEGSISGVTDALGRSREVTDVQTRDCVGNLLVNIRAATESSNTAPCIVITRLMQN